MFFTLTQRLLLLLAMAQTVPVRSQRDANYREEIVDAIIIATDDEQEQLLLVRIAGYESSYSRRIADCHCQSWECDKGKSIGLWQTQGGGNAQCGSPKLQAEYALKLIRRSREVCSSLLPEDSLSLYTNGRCMAQSKASRERWVSR